MRKLLVSALLLALIAGGCTQPPPPPPKAETKPAEPTSEEIAAKIRTNLAGYEAAVNAGAPLPKEAVDPLVKSLEAAAAPNRMSENGKAAIAQVSHEIDSLIAKARDARRWRLVKAGIQCHNALVPGSAKHQRLLEMADLWLQRPSVRLKGFFSDHDANGQIYAFIDVKDPSTGELETLQVREGEEFHNLKFIRIIGEQRGIELEYLKMPGETFEVMK